MGEILNLRHARKLRARVEREAQAALNRAAHGRPRAQRETELLRARREADKLDGHRLGDDER